MSPTRVAFLASLAAAIACANTPTAPRVVPPFREASAHWVFLVNGRQWREADGDIDPKNIIAVVVHPDTVVVTVKKHR
jgi:hypothetical protein